MVARFRPQNKVEIASGGEPIVEFETEDTCSIQVGTATHGEDERCRIGSYAA